jgi:hypothetical protein
LRATGLAFKFALGRLVVIRVKAHDVYGLFVGQKVFTIHRGIGWKVKS